MFCSIRVDEPAQKAEALMDLGRGEQPFEPITIEMDPGRPLSRGTREMSVHWMKSREDA